MVTWPGPLIEILFPITSATEGLLLTYLIVPGLLDVGPVKVKFESSNILSGTSKSVRIVFPGKILTKNLYVGAWLYCASPGWSASTVTVPTSLILKTFELSVAAACEIGFKA